MNTSLPSCLHVIDTTGPGGAETIFTQLAAATKAKGYPTLALIRGPGWVQSELARLGIETLVEDCKGSFNLKFLFKLIAIIRHRKISVIQSHLLGSNVYTSLAGRITGVPVYASFHGFVDIAASERFSAAKFFIIRAGARRVIAVTEQIKTMLCKVPQINPQKVMVIANGVDTQHFAPASKPYLTDGRAFIIGCLGNVRTAKNYPLAIQALARLVKEQNHNIELWIAGDDSNKLAQECKQLASDLGLNQHIRWLGFIQDAAGYLNSLDLFLLTSSSEGHPLALTQAMATGLPIVVTQCGVEHVVTEGKTALIADNNSLSSVVERITQLITDPELRHQMSAAAVVEARDRWSLAKTIQQYLSLYTP